MSKGCLIVLLGLGLVVGFSALFGLFFMWLWNAFVVGTFDAPELSFGAAWGIWILISMVGGAFRSTVSSKSE